MRCEAPKARHARGQKRKHWDREWSACTCSRQERLFLIGYSSKLTTESISTFLMAVVKGSLYCYCQSFEETFPRIDGLVLKIYIIPDIELHAFSCSAQLFEGRLALTQG